MAIGSCHFVLCVFIWEWIYSWWHTVLLVFSMLQVCGALSENGDIRLHSWMSYGADLCQQRWLCRHLPALYLWRSVVRAGIRLRTRELFLAQTACSYRTCFPWAQGPTAISSASSKSGCCVWWGRQLGEAASCPGSLSALLLRPVSCLPLQLHHLQCSSQDYCRRRGKVVLT